MPGWLSTLLETLLGPLGRWLRRLWAKKRVKKYIQELSEEQKEQLRIKHRIAEENPSHLYIDTITGRGGGADMTQLFLYELVEEEAIVLVEREDREDGGFSKMYRFQPWFHEYLSARPELLEK